MHTASYAIISRATGLVVAELWSAAVVAKINTVKYYAVPIRQHLASLSNRPAA